jgi:D-threo-aldose 1-dehydrogenase
VIDLEVRRRLGSTEHFVPPLCIGTSSWGRLRGGEIEATAVQRVEEVADRSLGSDPRLGYLDTSNIYGDSRAESLIGAALARSGALPDNFVLQTKLDRDLANGNFSAAQMWRSLEQSLERLGLTHLQVLFLHDPEVVGFDSASAPGGPMDALIRMKDRGLVDSIGISGGPVPMLQKFVDTKEFDVIITHNRYTLVDNSALPLLESAQALGMGVNNAAPYGGGGLSGRAGAAERYGYRDAPPEVRTAIEAMGRTCREAGVPLSAAALQFSLRDPLISSTVVGVSSNDRLDAALADAAVEIPDSLWHELDRLRPLARFALDAQQ